MTFRVDIRLRGKCAATRVVNPTQMRELLSLRRAVRMTTLTRYFGQAGRVLTGLTAVIASVGSYACARRMRTFPGLV
jgi:hypothetical protein